MKKSVLFLAFLAFISCSSPFKKKTSTFLGDSDFLKQGHKIEDYVEEGPKEEAHHKKNETELHGDVEPGRRKLRKNNKKVKVESKEKKTVVEEVKKKSKDKDGHKENHKVDQSAKFPFKVGEEVTLAATFFGVEAGKVIIGVDKFKKFEGKKQYHFYVFGRTSSIFSLFYKVKNKIESLWDPEIQRPTSLAFDVKESRQKYKIRVYFDWLKKKGEYLEEGWDNKKGDYKVHKKWALQDGAQDIVSGAFFMRTFPFKVGEEYKLSIMEEDKLINLHLKVDRKETLKTRVGKFKTIVLKPRFSVKGKFKQVGEISVWLTDDSYRQVVRIEMKIKLGTIVAKLHSIKRP